MCLSFLLFIYMPANMKMIFTSAGPLNRWGLPARTNSSVTNSRAVNRRATHRMNSALIGKYAKGSGSNRKGKNLGFTKNTKHTLLTSTGEPKQFPELGSSLKHNIALTNGFVTRTNTPAISNNNCSESTIGQVSGCGCPENNDYHYLVIYKTKVIEEMRIAYELVRVPLFYGMYEYDMRKIIEEVKVTETIEIILQESNNCVDGINNNVGEGKQISNRIEIS